MNSSTIPYFSFAALMSLLSISSDLSAAMLMNSIGLDFNKVARLDLAARFTMNLTTAVKTVLSYCFTMNSKTVAKWMLASWLAMNSTNAAKFVLSHNGS